MCACDSDEHGTAQFLKIAHTLALISVLFLSLSYALKHAAPKRAQSIWRTRKSGRNGVDAFSLSMLGYHT